MATGFYNYGMMNRINSLCTWHISIQFNTLWRISVSSKGWRERSLGTWEWGVLVAAPLKSGYRNHNLWSWFLAVGDSLKFWVEVWLPQLWFFKPYFRLPPLQANINTLFQTSQKNTPFHIKMVCNLFSNQNASKSHSLQLHTCTAHIKWECPSPT